MSTSDKLNVRVQYHVMSGRKVIPIYRKVGPKGGGDDSYERARDVEAVMDALPQIVAVVEAAESRFTGADAEHAIPTYRGKDTLYDALVDLDEALS